MWAAPRPRVHSIAIELTPFCNQRCDYCYNAWRDDGGASVGAPETKALLARVERVLDSISVEHVTITGGEPLASQDLFPLLDLLRRRHVRAQIISNGALVTDDIADRLARHRVLAVLVTLNAPDAALHDEIVSGDRDKRGFFDATIEGIRRLKARRVPVEGSIVLTRRNAHLAGDVARLFASLGVKKIALSRFSPAGYSTAKARELLPSPADVTRALEEAVKVARADGATTLFATMPLPPCVVDVARFPEIDFHHCPIGTSQQEFALGPTGEVRHCALHRSAIAADALDANVDLASVFAGHDAHGYRRHVPAHCKGCAHEATCGGGCGAAGLWLEGDRDGVRPLDPFVARAPSRRALPVLA